MSLFRFRLGNDGERSRTELPDGLYEDVVSDALASDLDLLSASAEIGRTALSGGDAIEHLANAIHQAARITLDSIGGKDADAQRLALANDLLRILQKHSASALGAAESRLRSELLLHVTRRGTLAEAATVPRRPATPLARSDLFVNAEKVGVLSEIRSEIESADRIDLIMAFIKWSGLLKFRDDLARHCQRGRPLRVLTTTYVGATEARAVAELHRILAPGGHVLCTVPGISQISRYDMDRWGDRWRLTSLSATELFSTAFEPEDVSVTTYGNVLACVCFLEGIVTERLRPRELDHHDEEYQLIVAVDAVKAGR